MAKPITPYQPNEFSDPVVARKVLVFGNEFLAHSDTRECYELAKQIRSVLSGITNVSVQQKYNSLLSRLMMQAYNYWPDNVAVEILETNLAPALEDKELDVLGRIRLRLVELPLLDRNDHRQHLIRYLEDNKEVLTIQDLMLEGKKVAGTIANWLLDYRTAVGAGIVSKLQRAEYLADSRNLRQLTADNKFLVTRLLDIFDYLKLSSETIEGYENDVVISTEDGRQFLLYRGEVTELEPEATTKRKALPIQPLGVPAEPVAEFKPEMSATEQAVLTAYQGDKSQQKAIAKELKKLDKKFGQNLAGLRSEFFTAVQKKQVDHTVACLMLLAQKNDLLEFIAKDEKLSPFLAAVWERQYGAELADEFRNNSTDIKFVKMFLQYVLEQRLGMSANDAARVGVQVGNVFAALGKKSYNKLAYFDVNANKFDWLED